MLPILPILDYLYKIRGEVAKREVGRGESANRQKQKGERY